MTSGTARRPGYYLLRPDGTMDAKVAGDAFDEECTSEYESVTKVVLDLDPVLRAFEVANLAYQQLQIAAAEAADQLSQTTSPLGGMAQLHDMQAMMQLRVVAFLSGARSFLDHTETAVRRLYGDQSAQCNTFKTHTKRLYDGHFSYRFVYELRNMSQHVTLPISVLNLDMQREQGTGRPSYKSELVLDRNHLLTSWSGWKSLVKREIEKQPTRFGLMPLLDEEIGWLRELCCGVSCASAQTTFALASNICASFFV